MINCSILAHPSSSLIDKQTNRNASILYLFHTYTIILVYYNTTYLLLILIAILISVISPQEAQTLKINLSDVERGN